MADLVIDIGNTALKAAWTDGMTLGRTFRYQGEKMFEFILSLIERNRPETIVLSSVRRFSQQNMTMLSEVCDRIIVVDERIISGHGLPSDMSSDRAASIIAARYLFKGKPCTVFDFGTMMTVDSIDEDGKFTGGRISPGCMTRFKSVHRYSRQLPLLGIPDEYEEKGISVSSSISSGVISGIIFEIEGYICQNPDNIIVFTGGDANFFVKRMKSSIFVVCNLVLMGLALIAVEYKGNE